MSDKQNLFELVNDIVNDYAPFGKSAIDLLNPFAQSLQASPVPSIEKYNECKANNGLSVWNKRGAWNCLFPRAYLDQKYGENDLTSKEDFVEGSDKHYFENFNDLLNWRSKMAEIEEKDRKSRWEARSKQLQEQVKLLENKASRWDEKLEKDQKIAEFDYDNGVERDFSLGKENGKNVVGTSKMSSYKTNENGETEEFTKLVKYYSDGTSHVEEKRNLIPKDQLAKSGKSDDWSWFWKK